MYGIGMQELLVILVIPPQTPKQTRRYVPFGLAFSRPYHGSGLFDAYLSKSGGFMQGA